MVQLHILSGKKAGSRVDASRFPFRIGRDPQNDLPLDDDGVWDQHIALEFCRNEGFRLAAAPEAIAAINSKPLGDALLRNGDVITLGSAKVQFWIAPARQRGLGLRENFVWALLGLVVLGQLVLIYLTLS
ncbi:MAG TPA: FHA domain-containing protein [Verrucomicrobiae bacterium]|jgi:pSer/pThr/pTyr-binding forkhead associated (FHA) protein|nr:FHA domain-containing protein [Verrucomicrobiae bacterium]